MKIPCFIRGETRKSSFLLFAGERLENPHLNQELCLD
jgi:hypothetical protein